MIVFKRFLYILMIVYFAGFSNVSYAEEKETVDVEHLLKQITELNEHIKAQKQESDNLKKTVKNQQSQIQTLQKNVSRVYKQTIEDTGQIEQQQQTAGALQQTVADQQEQIETLKGNLAFVYKQTIRDTGMIEKYKLGNEVYMRSSYFDLQRDKIKLADGSSDDEYDNAFVNYLDLKFSADPTDELRFNGTLTMYKLWGTWNAPESISSSDFNYSSNPSDSGVKVKRAYVDYRPQWLGRHLNLTFGRLPTSDGYLTRYRYNRPSQTSYPDLAFNAESDGAAITVYFDNPLIQSLNLVYARSEDDTDMYPFKKDAYGLDDIDFYVVQLNSKMASLENSDVTLQWLRVDNIRSTGDNLIREAVDNINTINTLTGKPPFVTQLIFPQELGYVDKYSIQLNNDHLFDSPVDFFASVAWSRSHPNGDRIYAEDGAGNPLDLAALPQFKDAASLYLVSSDNQDAHSGWAFYAGLRYNIESDRFKNPKIGLEYNQGSEYWVGLNVAASDPYQKLNTRGNVWEIYWVQPCVEDMLQFRTGYQYIDREYTETLFAGLYGASGDTDEKDKLFYCSFEFMF